MGVEFNIKVQNIVASVKFPEIKLMKLVELLMKEGYDVNYNPEFFPGVVIKMPNGDREITILLFKNGNIVITGGRSMEEIRQIVKDFYELLKKYDLIKGN